MARALELMKFRNPENDYIEEVTFPGLKTLLFGCFYFAAHGMWGVALISAVLAIITGGISWLVFPFVARQVLRKHYLRKGWKQVKPTKEEEGDIRNWQKLENRIAWSVIAITLVACVFMIIELGS